jgi:membrane protease YdiL (CAAX protease family)
VILAVALYGNVIANEVLAPAWYVPFNLGILVVTLFIARRAGTTWTSMGLRSDRFRRGLRVGLVVVTGVVVVAAILLALPIAREVARDERIVERSIWLSMYHAFVRIPLGTALYEEVLFRGVIFGMLVRRYSPLVSAVWSSLLFGLWHLLPAFDVLETNPVGDVFSGASGTVWALVGAVAATFLVGLAFQWIRLFANSVVAPILVHIGTNSVAIISAVVAVHLL